MENDEHVIGHTRRWISSIVIGLNLCPFAERVFTSNRIRYQVTRATEPSEVLEALARELTILQSLSRETTETSFLILPKALLLFDDFNDVMGMAEELVAQMGLGGVIQVVGFHPMYQFEGTTPKDAENYTNRSPYPMIHLLREESISEVAANPDELLEIPKRNIATLNRLGLREIQARLKDLADPV